MIVNDFEYNGLHASDFALKMCSFDGASDFETINVGAERNFNQVSVNHGALHNSTNTSYDSPLEATFQVCKLNCFDPSDIYFDVYEQRAIVRWLNRDSFHMLRIESDDDAYDQVQFEGSFNVSKIEHNGRVVGFELHFISNRPYALGNLVKYEFVADSTGYKYTFYDSSDEVGYIYPKSMTITCAASGTLKIFNSAENRTMKINNCLTGEVITFDDSLNINTSITSHKIQNDFNFNFFRIANSYDNRLNELTISLPCKISFEYYPIVKGVGL